VTTHHQDKISNVTSMFHWPISVRLIYKRSGILELLEQI